MNYRPIIIGFWFIASFVAVPAVFAQSNSISGTVRSAKTGKPLSVANIFLNNTTIGTTSDTKGNFTLKQIPSGAFKVVISFVGYKPFTKQMTFPTSLKRTFNVSLHTKINTLGEVTVKGSNQKCRKQLKKFKKYFLGHTRDAEHTTILNPHVLRFKSDHGKFVAVAVKPLKIKNEALGYHIKFYSEKLIASEQTYLTNGQGRYKLMKPKNKKQKNAGQKSESVLIMARFSNSYTP